MGSRITDLIFLIPPPPNQIRCFTTLALILQIIYIF